MEEGICERFVVKGETLALTLVSFVASVLNSLHNFPSLNYPVQGQSRAGAFPAIIAREVGYTLTGHWSVVGLTQRVGHPLMLPYTHRHFRNII